MADFLNFRFGLRRRTQHFQGILGKFTHLQCQCVGTHYFRFAFAFLSESFFVSAVDQTFPHWLNWPCSRAMCKKLEFVVFPACQLLHSRSFPLLHPTSKSPASPLPRQALLLSRLPRSGRPWHERNSLGFWFQSFFFSKNDLNIDSVTFI